MTTLKYEIQATDLSFVPSIVNTLQKNLFKCSVEYKSVTQAVITTVTDNDLSLNDVLYVGVLIGQIQAR